MFVISLQQKKVRCFPSALPCALFQSAVRLIPKPFFTFRVLFASFQRWWAQGVAGRRPLGLGRLEGKDQGQTVADLQRGRPDIVGSTNAHASLPRRVVLRLPRLRAAAAVRPARQQHAGGVAKERAAVLVVAVPGVGPAECGESFGAAVHMHGRHVDVGGEGRKQQGGGGCTGGVSGGRVVRCVYTYMLM